MKNLLFRNQGGFTLIEVLVALLVLAVGVLGMASMQLKAMQSAHAAYQRSIATMAAQDMVERLWMQLGKQAVDTGSIECPDASDTAYNTEFGTPDATDTVLEEWHSEWVEFIPTLVKDNAGEAGTDTVNRESGCKYTVTIKWQDERFLGEDVSSLVYVTRVIGVEPSP